MQGGEPTGTLGGMRLPRSWSEKRRRRLFVAAQASGTEMLLVPGDRSDLLHEVLTGTITFPTLEECEDAIVTLLGPVPDVANLAQLGSTQRTRRFDSGTILARIFVSSSPHQGAVLYHQLGMLGMSKRMWGRGGPGLSDTFVCHCQFQQRHSGTAEEYARLWMVSRELTAAQEEILQGLLDDDLGAESRLSDLLEAAQNL